MKEVQKVLEELKGVKPEQLTGEAKRLFEAIMKIADERDELLKERQADKEKIKELEAVNKRLHYTMNNAYLLDYIPRKEIEELKIEKVKRRWVHIKENGEVEPLFYVSEDKIKAKIEELKQKKYILSSRESEIEILQSLLEKE